MKCIKTTDAVGHVLCHDITRIVKDVVKDTAFRKGQYCTGRRYSGFAISGKRPSLCVGEG